MPKLPALNLRQLAANAPEPNEREPQPNAPCWCASGKKYRRCHLPRTTMRPVRIHELMQKVHRGWSAAKVCLHPHAPIGCSGGIIKAHTVQRGGGLTRIAEAGHVIGFDADPSAAMSAQRIGINRASTFTGFCRHHDAELFRPVETAPFDPSSREQVFLLMYRALAMELYKKRRFIWVAELGRENDRGRPYHQQRALHDHIDASQQGARLAIRDLEAGKRQLDAIFAARYFDRVRAVVVEISVTPDILCCAVVQPEVDFAGNVVQDLAMVTPPAEYIYCTVIPTEVGGAIILSWIDPSPASEAFAWSFERIRDAESGDACVRFLFESFENMYFRPSWWEGLATADRAALTGRFLRSLNPWNTLPRNRLTDDGVHAVSWPVVRRHQM